MLHVKSKVERVNGVKLTKYLTRSAAEALIHGAENFEDNQRFQATISVSVSTLRTRMMLMMTLTDSIYCDYFTFTASNHVKIPYILKSVFHNIVHSVFSGCFQVALSNVTFI